MLQQGKVVVESQSKQDGGGFLVMTPEGRVEWFRTKRSAEKHAMQWFKSNLGDAAAGIGVIEWR